VTRGWACTSSPAARSVTAAITAAEAARLDTGIAIRRRELNIRELYLHVSEPARECAMRGHQFLSVASGLLFPRICPGCGDVTDEANAVCCEACAFELNESASADYCRRCGSDAGLFEMTEQRCPQCRNEAWSISGLVRVARYDGLVGALVRRFKHGAWQHLDAFLGGMMAAAISGATWADEVQWVAPIASPWQRRWRRGFWPTGLLAREVARRIDRPFVPLLAANRYWGRQVGRLAKDRRENVRGVFRVRAVRTSDRPAVCLIEDVVTTGATINEAARALRHAGYGRVYVAILARAL
jgi:ComF family protein